MKRLPLMLLLILSTTALAQTNQVVTIDAENAQQQLPSLLIEEFTINKDTQLGAVLRALARLANVNIAFSDTVENLGPFRFHMNNPTPWNEVLESILNVYHLSYEIRGDIITVMTVEDVNQMYTIEKQKNQQMQLRLQQKAMNPLRLKIVQVKYAKVADLVPPLTKVLQQNAEETPANEVRGSVTADVANNSIILHAPQSEIDKLSELLLIMDRKTQQVRIEATLVEVSSQFAYELGVRWSFHANNTLSSPSETRSPVEVSPMTLDQDSGTFTLSDPTYHTMQGIIDSATGEVDYGIIGRDFALGMNLNALEEDGKIKILSRPSLTTMDNQKAEIKSGSDIPYRTQDQYGNPVVEYKEAVLSLNVLPHIVDDQAIFMDIAITKDEPDFSQEVDGNPVVLKKFVQTRMMVLDGQTAVIGGLTKNSNFNRDGGIPFLKSIPYLGRLFSSKSKQNDEEELMIFLTPRIVPQNALDNSAIVQKWMDRAYYEQTDSETNDVEKISFTDIDLPPPTPPPAESTHSAASPTRQAIPLEPVPSL